MAQEVSLDSLQELEQEAVLRVLHRDRAVQSIEEERVRYAPWMGGLLGWWLFLLGAAPGTWHMAPPSPKPLV